MLPSATVTLHRCIAPDLRPSCKRRGGGGGVGGLRVGVRLLGSRWVSRFQERLRAGLWANLHACVCVCGRKCLHFEMMKEGLQPELIKLANCLGTARCPEALKALRLAPDNPQTLL